MSVAEHPLRLSAYFTEYAYIEGLSLAVPDLQEKALPGLLVINAVPTAPGQCRVLLTAMYPRSSLPGLFRSILALMPRSMKHLAFSARIFDGDSSLLHAQVCSACRGLCRTHPYNHA